jgi:tyrosine-protein kinase Etk/Wzc
MEKYTEQPPETTEEKPINLRELFEKFIGYWPWIVASVVFALIAGYFYVRISPKQYQFTASVLVIDQSKNSQMDVMSVVNQLDALGISGNNPSMVNDEQQVIQSRDLMGQVVHKLQLYTSYYQYSFLHKAEIYTASPLYVNLDSTSLAHLHASLELQISPEENHALSIDASYGDHKWTWKAHQLPIVLQTPVGSLLIQQRPGQLFPDEKLYVTIINPIAEAKNLATNSLSTDVGKQTDVISLTLVAENVQKGQDILNTLIKIYNNDAIDQINQAAINTATFIDSRLKLLTGELSTVEDQAQHFKQANNIIDAEAQAQLVLGDANTYQQQTVTVETQLHLIDYVEQFLRDPKYHNALVPNLGITDVGLIAVINGYNEMVLERERIARNSSADNPALSTLNHQVEAARKAILVSIANTRKGMTITRQDLGIQNSLINAKLYAVPRKEREFLEIQRQQQVKETLYLFLLQKREEAALQMAVTVPKARVINSPDDSLQVAPRTSLILLVFFVLGLAIPILIIYVRDLIDTSIHSREDVEAVTNLPVLTELGHNTSGQSLVDQHDATNSNPELLRLLRTKLQFVLDYPTQKVVMVTSTEPGEGKTFVSTNLAITLSMADKKVLLMGLDLRKPQLTKLFGLPDKEGITSYLTGLESDVHKFVLSIPEYPNLDLLPSGMIPPNPNELIMRQRLDDMFEILKPEYDYIILDTAPVGAVSDTLLLHRFSDVTLYVCRAEYSDRRNLQFVDRLAKEGSLNPIYIIINDVHMEKHHYGYRYGYRHGYRYGYGHYHKNQE